jgi:hypothetical protein
MGHELAAVRGPGRGEPVIRSTWSWSFSDDATRFVAPFLKPPNPPVGPVRADHQRDWPPPEPQAQLAGLFLAELVTGRVRTIAAEDGTVALSADGRTVAARRYLPSDSGQSKAYDLNIYDFETEARKVSLSYN